MSARGRVKPTLTSRDKPETVWQAQTFEKYKNRYVIAGVCHYCAAQAAFGHQHGFGQVEPPRSCCAEVVAGLPVEKSNGWRALLISSYARDAGGRSEAGVSVEEYPSATDLPAFTLNGVSR